MKKILITGAGSYIGTSVERWLMKPEFAGMYQVDTVDMRGEAWREKDFSGYDTVFHVAGIAHQKEKRKNIHLYYEINRDLAIETAKKAKTSGVNQFFILSTMSVYGITTGTISKDMNPVPKNNYGKSKLQADIEILKMENESFHVAIIRPPMVYGEGCKGNYQSLVKVIKKTIFFPDIENKRSMIYINNLAEFCRILIEKNKYGIFIPQNQEYVCTSSMAKLIAKYNGKKIIFTCIFNWFIKRIKLNVVYKVFGNLIYEKVDLCNYVGFEDSVRMSEYKY